MKKIFWTLAIATTICSCTNSNNAKNDKIVVPLRDGLVKLSEANSLLASSATTGTKSPYVDSLAISIDLNEPYQSNLLKIYEMQLAVAEETSIAWINTAVRKYMQSEDTLVYTNDNSEKDASSFRRAIIQSLVDAQSSLETCQSEETIDLQDLSTLSFDVLNAYNTFFFCYYFVTDNKDYLTFLSGNSQIINNLKTYADSLFNCGLLSDEEAFELASTLESTAFLITMGTLSFNILWNDYEKETQQYADFFNSYSEKTIASLLESKESCDFNKFSGNEYMKYMAQASKYKAEIMNLVIDSFKNLNAEE